MKRQRTGGKACAPMAGAMLLALAIPLHKAEAGSLRFSSNQPQAYEFADIGALPASFGEGELAFELWIRPAADLPVGLTSRATLAQLRNWSEADPAPYSSEAWWLAGNWLIDGMTRPRGFGAGDSRIGSFGLQFYGGGRLRWLFADSDTDMPPGMVYAVQAWPGSQTQSLLDGRWHHIVAVRRWDGSAAARLELWIDGALIAATPLKDRINMRPFWNHLAHPDDPATLGGRSIGAEVMTAWGQVFTQYEDYKGLIDDVRLWRRAPSPAEISAWAKGDACVARDGLVAHFPFTEGRGLHASDRLDPGYRWTLHPQGQDMWSAEDAPTQTSCLIDEGTP